MESIAPIAFPYRQSDHTKVVLNKVILTDPENLFRYVFQLGDVNGNHQCVTIDKINSDSGESSQEPFNFISNPTADKRAPLLVKCDPRFYKIKLSLSIKCTSNDQNKSLYIVKTKGTNCNLEHIKQALKPTGGKDRPKFMEVSQIRFNELPLEHKIDSLQRIIVNDSYSNTNFHDCLVNLFLFESDGTNFNHLLDFKFWADTLDASSERTNKSEDIQKQKHEEQQQVREQERDLPLQFSDYRSAFSFSLDDGPEFRKVLEKYEQSIPNIHKNVILLIDEVKNMEMIMKRMLGSKAKIYDIIRNFSNMNPILSKLEFKESFKKQFNQLFEPFTAELQFFLTQVCDKKSLEKIKSISSFDDEKNELHSLKKAFEHDSKEFYNWLKKYLSNEKDRPELKLLMKRKKFELSKFDYLNYLNNFTNNQYINDFIENLFKFTAVDLKNLPSDLSKVGLTKYQTIYLNVLLQFNSEKFKLRQMIESCEINDELTNLIRFNNLTIETASSDDVVVTQENMDQIFSPVTPTGGSIDTTEKGQSEASINSTEELGEKSGILYALGGKGKQGWHKEWVVIKSGELREYSDWRKGSDPINVPIQIALCNVKPTTHDKRQYCFEIFTSQGNKYVFQAINAQERDSWLKTLENARQLINTDKLQESLVNYSSTKYSNSGHTHSKIGKKLLLKLEKPKITPSTDNMLSPVSVKSNSIITKDYYKTVRSIPDSNNHICADCGSTDSVEWISLNFLVVLCIKCSSFHRNMGSHVSKVKSLKLDNFEREIEVLLGYINNKSHNEILEKTVSFDKAKITDYDERLQFIKNKYIERKYIQAPDNVNELLLKAIQCINIQDTIKYVLLKANLDSLVQLRDKGAKITLFSYSLRKYLVVETNEGQEKLFVISEFLALNGSKISKVHHELELTKEAYEFWQKKYLKTV